jgi:hypothetical protein
LRVRRIRRKTLDREGPRWRNAWLLFCLIPPATKKGPVS